MIKTTKTGYTYSIMSTATWIFHILMNICLLYQLCKTKYTYLLNVEKYSISERDPIVTHVYAVSIPLNTACMTNEQHWTQVERNHDSNHQQTNYVPTTVTYHLFSHFLVFLSRPTAQKQKEGTTNTLSEALCWANKQISNIRREIWLTVTFET